MKMEIAVIAMAAVLLFGCFGGGNGGATPTPNPTQGGSATPTPGGNGGATPTPQNGGGGLAGLGWDALVGLGTPMQCTIVSEGQTWHLKVKGDKFRSESTMLEDGQTANILMIGKDNAMYMQMTDEMRQMPGASDCVWLMMEADESEGSTATNVETVDYASLPPENLSCVPAIFGDEVFATVGKVCSLDDLMAGMMPTPSGEYGDACAYCNMITDPQDRAECLQYCAQ